MAPDTWDPATCQGSIEARGASPYISILDDKTQIRILGQKRGSGGASCDFQLKGGENEEAVVVNADVMCVSRDKGDRNALDLDLIKAG